MWWIIPSTDFPSYKFGKYFICDNKDGTFSVGFHIEKGLEKAVDYKRELMLDDSWIWHDFIEALGNGDIEDVLRGIYRG